MSEKEISLRTELVQRLELTGSSKTRKKDQEKYLKDEIQSGEVERCPLCQSLEREARELEYSLKDRIGEERIVFEQKIVVAPGEIMKACRLYQQNCPWCQGRGEIPVQLKETLYALG